MARTGEYTRKTNETDISVSISLDGSGTADIDTGIGFFDHMLNSFARHGLFDLKVAAAGDLYVDSHHIVEDTGIVLGRALSLALGDKRSIRRYGFSVLPMDESLALCAIDLSGRPYLEFDARFGVEKVGYLETETVREFFRALSNECGMNLHIMMLKSGNTHHMIEAIFKAFSKALDMAVLEDDRISDVLSTKGSL